MTTRLTHPPSLPRANGRCEVRTRKWPGMNTSANDWQPPSSRHRATQRPARDVSRASRVRDVSPPCDAGHRRGRHVAHKAIYLQGRALGACGGAGSDVVEVWSALPPTALPVPSFVPLCAPSRRHLAWRMRRFGSVGASGLEVVGCISGCLLARAARSLPLSLGRVGWCRG